MDPTWTWNTDTLQFVTAVIGAFLAIALIIRKAAPRIQSAWRYVAMVFTGHKEATAKLDALNAKVDMIIAEIRPNGGTSIKDALTRIEARSVLHEQRQRAILSGEDTGVFETDPSGKFVWVNRKLARIANRSVHEMMGYGWVNSLDSAYRDKVSMEYEEAFAEQREYSGLWHIQPLDGEKRLVEVKTFKMLGQGDVVIGYIGLVNPPGVEGLKL